VTGHCRPGARAGKGRLAGQHLVQHAGQTVEVATAVEVPLGAGLFRAHVCGSAHGKAAIGDVDVISACGPHGGCHPEVGHHRLAFLQQDVLRLDVAMDDVMPVGVAECSAHGPGNSEGGIDRQLTLALQPVPQTLAAGIGHHEIQ